MRNDIKPLLELLLDSLSVVLISNANKVISVKRALSHVDVFILALESIVNKQSQLLSKDDLETVRKIISVSLSKAIKTKSRVLMTTDKLGRRYELVSMLERFVLLRILNARIKEYSKQAVINNQLLKVSSNSRTVKFKPLSDPDLMEEYIRSTFFIHPYTHIELSLES